jgi:hypothetical protein
MADIIAAIETLVNQKIYFENELHREREMAAALRASLVEHKIEIDALREQVRKLQAVVRQRPEWEQSLLRFLGLDKMTPEELQDYIDSK